MSYYTDVIQKDPRFRTTTKVDDMGLLEPLTRGFVSAIVAAALAEHGVTLRVTETYRSQERQEQLYAQGATHLKEVGTHHYGIAADFCKIVTVGGKEEASWSGDWTFLRDLGERYGFTWGGEWGDADHLQRCELSEQPKLFAGTWYPGDEEEGGTSA